LVCKPLLNPISCGMPLLLLCLVVFSPGPLYLLAFSENDLSVVQRLGRGRSLAIQVGKEMCGSLFSWCLQFGLFPKFCSSLP
jgi:hypothetical protein